MRSMDDEMSTELQLLQQMISSLFVQVGEVVDCVDEQKPLSSPASHLDLVNQHTKLIQCMSIHCQTTIPEHCSSFVSEVSKHPWTSISSQQLTAITSVWLQLSIEPSCAWFTCTLISTLVSILYVLQISSPAPVEQLAARMALVSVCCSTVDKLLDQLPEDSQLTAITWQILCDALLQQVQFTRKVARPLVPYRLFITHFCLQRLIKHSKHPHTAVINLMTAVIKQAVYFNGQRRLQSYDLLVDQAAAQYQALAQQYRRYGKQYHKPAYMRQQKAVIFWNELTMSGSQGAEQDEPTNSNSCGSGSSSSGLPQGQAPLGIWSKAVKTCNNCMIDISVECIVRAVSAVDDALGLREEMALRLLGHIHGISHKIAKNVSNLSGGKPTAELLQDVQRQIFHGKSAVDAVKGLLDEHIAWVSVVILISRNQPGLCDGLSRAVLNEVIALHGTMPADSSRAGIEHAVRLMLSVRLLTLLLAHASNLLMTKEDVLDIFEEYLEFFLTHLYGCQEDQRERNKRDSLSDHLLADSIAYILLHRIADIQQQRHLGQHANLLNNVDLLLSDYLDMFLCMVSYSYAIMIVIFVFNLLDLVLSCHDAIFAHIQQVNVQLQDVDQAAAMLAVPQLGAACHLHCQAIQHSVQLLLVSWPCSLPVSELPDMHSMSQQELLILHNRFMLKLHANDQHVCVLDECSPSADGRKLLDLPEVLLSDIISWLSYKRVARLEGVCRYLHDLIRNEDERLWRDIYQQSFPKHIFVNHIDKLIATSKMAADVVLQANTLCSALSQNAPMVCLRCKARRREQSSIVKKSQSATNACCLSQDKQHSWRLLLKERVLLLRSARRRYRSFKLCPAIGCSTIIKTSGKHSLEHHYCKHIDQLERALQPKKRRGRKKATVECNDDENSAADES